MNCFKLVNFYHKSNAKIKKFEISINKIKCNLKVIYRVLLTIERQSKNKLNIR